MSHPLKYVTAAEALSVIQSGHRVFIQGMAATPRVLIEALVAQAPRLRGVHTMHLHTEGDAPYVLPQYAESFITQSLFVASNLRQAVADGHADYIPMFLSEVPGMFRSGLVQLDVALVHVSPPDAHGFCSLGTSVDASNAAVDTARYVIAQVNPRMPRTHGDGMLHMSCIHAMVAVDEPLYGHTPAQPTPTEQQIGRHVASLVQDGATLQMGIGAIPNAVLQALGTHKDLGIHTEMFSDGVIELVERGIINGRHKAINHEKIVAGFVLGSQRLYDFVHDNLLVELLDVGYVNDPVVIMRNPKVTAINSALEVDLTGQVCADSIGTRHYSGVGGQMDFMRGAARSPGGRPIIALPSTTSKGDSRILSVLKPGAAITTTRAHVHYVVTEHGIAHVYGQTLRQRAKALIAIAHPKHQESLEREAYDRFKVL